MGVIGPSEDFRDKISTVSEEGKRIWVYPKKPSGRYHFWRNVVAWGLLLFMFGGPFLEKNGEPFFLLNVVERKFILFGVRFWPQDMYILVLIFITAVVSIILFTVIYGRLFCGWVCPQTIFMESVFRKIEYLIEGDYTKQKKLAKQPWNTEKVLKKGAKHLVFFGMAFLISNIFLAWIIGKDELFKIISEPVSEHVGGFAIIIGFSLAFYWVFAWFREQVCTIACPYGRLQGVMLDKNSVVIAYDHVRGEPRGKLRKGEERKKGDCIDCKQCVHVCPTGIDIRNGTQMECINCTACIDACDDIMDRINKPRGLIKFASENQIEKKQKFRFTTRMIAYTAFLSALMILVTSLIFVRSDIDVTFLRTPGKVYQELEDGYYANMYNATLINKTQQTHQLEIKLVDKEGNVRVVGNKNLMLEKSGTLKVLFFVDIPGKELQGLRNEITLGLYSDGKLLTKEEVSFMAPVNP